MTDETGYYVSIQGSNMIFDDHGFTGDWDEDDYERTYCYMSIEKAVSRAIKLTEEPPCDIFEVELGMPGRVIARWES